MLALSANCLVVGFYVVFVPVAVCADGPYGSIFTGSTGFAVLTVGYCVRFTVRKLYHDAFGGLFHACNYRTGVDFLLQFFQIDFDVVDLGLQVIDVVIVVLTRSERCRH